MQQEWTKAQNEVINFVQHYINLLMEEKYTESLKFIHPEYKDRYNISNKYMDIVGTVRKTENNVHLQVDVQRVKLFGSCAIIQHLLQISNTGDKNGNPALLGKFTDVLSKENGNWFFIADHNITEHAN